MIPPVWVKQGETVKHAFKRMHENGLPGLPVVDDRYHVIGYINLLELLAICMDEKENPTIRRIRYEPRLVSWWHFSNNLRSDCQRTRASHDFGPPGWRGYDYLCVLPQAQAFHAVDWNVIFLLAAMMIIANVLKETGLFQWIALQAVRLGKGDPFAFW